MKEKRKKKEVFNLLFTVYFLIILNSFFLFKVRNKEKERRLRRQKKRLQAQKKTESAKELEGDSASAGQQVYFVHF
jgi:uncharacterized membrane protein YciS (DUF1049 family)